MYNNCLDYCNALSLSLSLSLSLKPESHLLRVKSSIYPLGSSLSSCSLSCWMSEGTSSIKHFFPYFAIMKKDFCGCSYFLGHSSFNVIDIRYEHLINVEMTIVLGSMSFFLCPWWEFWVELLSSPILLTFFLVEGILAYHKGKLESFYNLPRSLSLKC